MLKLWLSGSRHASPVSHLCYVHFIGTHENRCLLCTVAGVTTATTEDAGGLAAHSLSSISIGVALFVLLNVVTHYGLCGRGLPYRGGYISLSLGTTLEPRSGRRSGPDLPAARPQSRRVPLPPMSTSICSALLVIASVSGHRSHSANLASSTRASFRRILRPATIGKHGSRSD